MKLAIITDEVSQDFERVLAFARDFALDGLEIRSVWDKGPHKLSDDEVERIGNMARQANLEICSVAAPVFKCDLHNAAEVAEHIAILQRCTQVAESWQAPIIRVFTGWRAEDPGGEHEHIAALFHDKLLPIVAGKSIKLGVENESPCNAGTGTETTAFLNLLDSSQATLVYDPCNSFVLGMDDPFREDYPAVRGQIGHFHVKDAARDDGKAECVALGDGKVGIPEHVEALRADGYDGWVSLETHWRMKAVLDEATHTLPGGQTFTEGAEPASRECMRRLQSWVRGA
ncbi:MAG TPA: sugar phosphate isomerase/epimerase family protein [Abditibacteriaceae bacterium]|nr:sugar phosphate isomerase/epimerase family protein [Abditibacteriaceae bacterium]